MAKKKFSDFQTFIALTLVCIGAASVLAVVHHLTKKPIKDAELRQKQEALRIVLPKETVRIDQKTIIFEGSETEIHVGKDSKGRLVGYAVEATTSEGYGGDVVFLIGLDAEGKIKTYKIMIHKETPGLGDNLTSPEFKKQFIGKNLDNFTFKVTKDGGDVQAITAATISSRAACDALKRGLEIFKAFKKGQ